MTGPLKGLRVVELAGIGPVPFAGMVLSDLGADVVLVDRTSSVGYDPQWLTANLLNRGRRSVAVDLKQPDGLATVLELLTSADVLLEGFRPGVMERLGLGPDVCHARNPRLVYGRMTGWGQDGPQAPYAGHDSNYLALTGVLDAIRREGERPMVPLNLLGDFGGGGMLLVVGVLAALWEARTSGEGQVVDAAIVDGVATLSTIIWGLRSPLWGEDVDGFYNDRPGTNMLDTGSHFCDVYECADGRFLTLAAVEPQFYAELCRLTGFEADVTEPKHHHDRSTWPERKAAMATLLKTRTRDEWAELLERTNACATPVLTFAEAPEHAHNKARGTFLVRDGIVQPAPSPRFSRTPGEVRSSPPMPGQHTDEVLQEWAAISDERLGELRAAGAIA